VLFDTWYQVARVAIVGVLAYAALIVGLRVSGKRTLAKLNAFDLVVTVALGSTLATTLLSSDVSLVEGVVAMGVLVLAQLVVSWSSVRWRLARRAARSSPAAVVLDGRMLESVMREQRVTATEVRQAVRSAGQGSVSDVAAVVLETDGTLSVISSAALGDGSALVDLRDPRSGGTIGPGPRRSGGA
jgi:uncharacterized membrane protein YcaP (DUF421 family)